MPRSRLKKSPYGEVRQWTLRHLKSSDMTPPLFHRLSTPHFVRNGFTQKRCLEPLGMVMHSDSGCEGKVPDTFFVQSRP